VVFDDLPALFLALMLAVNSGDSLVMSGEQHILLVGWNLASPQLVAGFGAYAIFTFASWQLDLFEQIQAHCDMWLCSAQILQRVVTKNWCPRMQAL